MLAVDWMEKQVAYATQGERLWMVLRSLERNLENLGSGDQKAYRRALDAAAVLLAAYPRGGGPRGWEDLWGHVASRLLEGCGREAGELEGIGYELLPLVRRIRVAVEEAAGRGVRG